MSHRRRRRDPVDVSTRVRRWTKGQATSTSPVGRLRAAWPDVVGVDAARQTLIVRCSRAGVVAVACASGAWAQELNLRGDRILAELGRAVTGVELTGIRFVIGDHVMPEESGPQRREPVTPTADDLAVAETETPPLDDDALRGLLVRARAAQIALERQNSLQRANNRGRRSRPG